MELEYKLSFIDTLSMAAGFAVGSGIITLTGIGIGMTGRSVFLAFPVCSVLFLVSFRPLFIMSGVHPSMSAAYEYSKTLLGVRMGGFYSYIYLLGRLTIAIFGVSFAQYAAALFPVFDAPGAQRLLASLMLTFFYVVNLLGIKTASRLQTLCSVLLLLGLGSFVFFGLGKVRADFFTTNFFTGGIGGFYSAVSLLFFAVSGAYIITDFAPRIRNPAGTMLKVIHLVTAAVTVLYMLIGVVAAGCGSVDTVAGKPLSVTAQIIYPNRILFGAFVIIGVMGALVTTLNSSFLWYASSLEKPCLDGWLPSSWIKRNRFGVPYRLMTVFYLFGLIPTVLGMDLAILSKVAVGLTILSAMLPMAGVIRLPSVYPEEWKNSRFAKKYSERRLSCICALSILIMSTQVIALFAGNPPAANTILVALIVISALYANYRAKNIGKTTGNKNVK
ncbi:MAG: amino acid permease [Oscillospiraceae bacterium]|nr:amino acid permease [Oscillospiraceae bacterium]